MSGKKRTNILIGVFAVLLILVVITQIGKNRKGESTLRAELITAEIDEINRMSLYTKAVDYEEIQIRKEGDQWRILYGEDNFPADQDLVNNMIDELTVIKPEKLIATNKDAWTEYDVTDTSGARVELYRDNKKLDEIYIGRFAYNQQTRQPTTYVRLGGDKAVYGVAAYLSMTFSRDINGLRDKALFRGNRNDLSKLTYTYPGDSSFTLNREGIAWLADGVPADSAQSINYLNSITYLTGNEFQDNFDPNSHTGEVFMLVIDQVDLPSVEITAYADGPDYVLHSTENPETYFASGDADLFNKIFKGPSHFMMRPIE